MSGLRDLLRATVEKGASDLHLAVGSPPQVRVNGRLQKLDLAVLTRDRTCELVQSALSEGQRAKFDETCELDLAMEVAGVGRFRANVFRQRGAHGAVFRLVPPHIRSLEELRLPAVVAQLADRPRGLVLVTGPTGSGKSTTLAAMVDRINTYRPVHILTIEDPIEHVHTHKRALVSQRELHSDTQGFGMALRAALREDPDVVLIGEMRDLDTMAAAMTLAETGHLTLATLHTNSAAQTVSRLVDAFPAHQQGQIRTQLSLVLEGIVCQALLPAIDDGRVAALEVLIATPAIRALIRDDKVHQIYGVMQTGQDRLGMQTMAQSLGRLVQEGVVARDVAMDAASNRDELAAILDRHRVVRAVGAES